MGDQKSMKNFIQFEATIWANHNTVAMDQNLENYDLGLKEAEILKKRTDCVIKSNKCNQCDYSSSCAINLRRHLKIHSGEKSKCSQ